MRRFVLSLAMTGIAALAPNFALAGDQETAQQIADGLRGSGQLVDYSIGVKYKKGAAVLLGRVASEDQKTTAEHLAKGMPGVKKVVNKLEIKPTAVRAKVAQRSAGPAVRTAVSASAPQFQLAGEEYEVEADEPVLATPMVRQPVQPVRMTRRAPRPLGVHSAGAPGQFVPMQGRRAPPQRLAQGPAPAGMRGRPIPTHVPRGQMGVAPARYDQPHMPNHAWPSYAAYPNYAAVTYPKQYSPTAWPYIGPFYPYPQVPLGWRKVTLEWDDGWWMLDFDD
jgi:hypothetical protein